MTTVPLTSLSHGAGCGCKLPAASLLPIVAGLSGAASPDLIVGSATGDDAAVFRLSDDLALVQTIDFFTPIVDDPFDFGRIAAANALSDVYAMGGRPLTAMNVVAFPLEELGGDVLREVLRGGLAVVEEAGAALVGGHSIEDAEPKYGLAVTGVVHPAALVTNAGGRAGDVLVLTKPLGVGAIVTARKRGAAGDALLAAAVDVMAALNAAACEAALRAGAHAMTDVTGFGLVGHALGMMSAGGVSLHVALSSLPVYPRVRDMHAAGVTTGSTRPNRAHGAGRVRGTLDSFWDALVHDPQTSGGLLIAVDAAAADELVRRLVDAGVEHATRIGEVRASDQPFIDFGGP